MSNYFKNIPLNNSTFEQYEIEALTKFDNNVCSRKFQRYIQVLNQLVGLISVRGNEYFEKRQNELMTCVFTNGIGAITFLDNKLQIWNIGGEIKYDINGDIEYVDLLPYTSIYTNTNININKRRFSGKKLCGD